MIEILTPEETEIYLNVMDELKKKFCLAKKGKYKSVANIDFGNLKSDEKSRALIWAMLTTVSELKMKEFWELEAVANGYGIDYRTEFTSANIIKAFQDLCTFDWLCYNAIYAWTKSQGKLLLLQCCLYSIRTTYQILEAKNLIISKTEKTKKQYFLR